MYKKDVIVDISGIKNIKVYNNGYVYYWSKVWWDPATKHSQDDRTIIGKLVSMDDKTKIYPNENYYNFFPNTKVETLEEPKKIDTYLHAGAYLCLLESSKKYGLFEALIKNFPKNYKKILALAVSYIDSEDSTSQHYDKWSFSNYSGLTSSMTPSMITELYQSINQDSIDDFLKDYYKAYIMRNQLKGKRCIAFDSTNQNTSAEKISSAEYGHPKIDEGLPVINTALMVDEETGIPIFYEHFYGSLLDKTELPKTLERANDLGLSKLFFMFDRGYFAKKSLNTIKDSEFAIMTPENNKEANNIIDKYVRLIEDENYYIKEENVYGLLYDGTYMLDGETKLNAHIYYDPERASEEKNTIHNKLLQIEEKLRTTKYYSQELVNRFDKFFNITKTNKKSKKSSFTFTRNTNEINKEMKRAGMFIILTNTNLTSKELIIIARTRDKCEKGFKRIKSHFDLAKALTHNDNTYNGKMFVAFVALCIVETFRYYIKDILKSTSSTTTFTVLSEMSKLIIYRKKDNTWALRYALTKRIKDVLSKLDLSENSINSFIEEINSV